MDVAEIELGEKLLGVGNVLLNPPSHAEELLPILDQAENLLSKVEQSPVPSIWTALCPVVKGLVTTELLRNLDIDVKVAVASCISEIVRITAPDAPYEDELMREIFDIFVEAFKGLSDIDSQSYSKRLSILETLAMVRSCVLMLDLECEELILQMFSLFFQTISERNAAHVMPLMEIIMTAIFEESEDIRNELVSCVLDSVKRDNNGISRMLGEKVIENCAAKLKPHLLEIIRSKSANLGGYSSVIMAIYQNDLSRAENIDLNGSGLDDYSKLSERTISEERQLGPEKIDIQIACPEKDVVVVDKRLAPTLSDNTVSMANEHKPLQERVSPVDPMNLHPDVLGVASTSMEENIDNMDFDSRKIAGSPCKSSEKVRIQKIKLLIHSPKKDYSEVVRRKDNCEVPCLGKNHVKRIDHFGSGISLDKMDVTTALEDGSSERRVWKGSDNETMLINSTVSGAGTTKPACPRTRRGLSFVLKSPTQKCGEKSLDEFFSPSRNKKASAVVDAEELVMSSSSGKNKKNTNNIPHTPLRSKMVPAIVSACAKEAVSHGNDDNKGLDGVNKAMKPLKTSRRRGHLRNAQDVEAPSSYAHGMMQNNEADIKCDLAGKIKPSSEIVFKRGRRKGRTSNIADGRVDQTSMVITSKTKSKAKGSRTQHKSNEIVTKSRKKYPCNANTREIEPSGELEVFKHRPRGRTSSLENSEGNQTLLDMISSLTAKAKLRKKFNHSDQSSKKHSSSVKKGIQELDENVVGRHVEVWWPIDKKFYPGFIESFDPVSKKHKVLYEDGDVEILLLTAELWRFTRDQNSTLQEISGKPGYVRSDEQHGGIYAESTHGDGNSKRCSTKKSKVFTPEVAASINKMKVRLPNSKRVPNHDGTSKLRTMPKNAELEGGLVKDDAAPDNNLERLVPEITLDAGDGRKSKNSSKKTQLEGKQNGKKRKGSSRKEKEKRNINANKKGRNY